MPESPFSAARSPARIDRAAALEAFMSGLIDYAGMFPPARLSLEDAITNYAVYRHSDDAWMLGRFVIACSRLEDLEPFTDLFQPDDPSRISALGTGGDDGDVLLEALEADLRAIERFNDFHRGRARADVMEVRLPQADVEAGVPRLETLLMRFAETIDRSSVRLDSVCLEVGLDGGWRASVESLLEALQAARSAGVSFAVKIRCGGPSPQAIPGADRVAFVIARARDARIPFKATAGLHHPVRHHDGSLGVMQHGFLNVFGAGVLAHALDLTEPGLRQVVRNEQAGSFIFDDDGFAFQDLRVSVDQVRAARTHFALSFGSCSFDEPREDLRRLRLL